MTCEDDHDLSVAILLQRYVDGACTADERLRIEQAPDLMERANELRRLDNALRHVFAAGFTPTSERLDPAELIAYVEGMLDEQRRQIIEQRISEDAELRVEVELLLRMGKGWSSASSRSKGQL
jgi:anti-sigma factor RsiW